MAKEERVIKRYTNRKLYDTRQSRYVTLDDIAKLLREGEEVRVVDNETADDLTAITLAQIILEEEKRKTHVISVPFLRNLIRSGESAMQDLSDSATRSIEAIGELTERAGDAVRGMVEDTGRAIDEGRKLVDDALRAPQRRLEALRVTARDSVTKIRQSPALQREIERIEKSLQAIEEMVGKLRDTDIDAELAEAAAPAKPSPDLNGSGNISTAEATEAEIVEPEAPAEDPAVAELKPS